jgi:DNA (cytosine-5)-methyltransferase 1
VFVVGYLGDWQRAAQVLFERESVRRDSPPSREAREAVAGTIAARFGISRNNHEELAWSECVGGGPDGGRIAGTVSSKWSKGSGGPAGDECYNMVAQVFKVRGGVEREDGSRGSTNIGKQAGKGYLGSEERAFTLAAAQDQFVAQPVAFHPTQDPISSEDGTTHAMGCGSKGGAATVAVAQPVAYGIDGEQNASEELIGTLRSHQSGGYEGARVAQPVAFEPGSIARNAGPVGESPLAPTLRREMGDNQPAVRIDMQVRRLTPVECERLQGFPDGYTNIPWRKKDEAPDGPRYKALGNSMAVPCMAWIGKRIAEVDNDPLA